MSNTLKIVVGALVLGALLGAGGWYMKRPEPIAPEKIGDVEAFAQCTADKGATMYGAYWCSHCQNQKKLFGDAFSKVHYVECATQGSRNQAKACTDAGVKGYPTWTFGDGSRSEGEQSFQQLAEKTGCPLPGKSDAPLPPPPAEGAEADAGAAGGTMPALSGSPDPQATPIDGADAAAR